MRLVAAKIPGGGKKMPNLCRHATKDTTMEPYGDTYVRHTTIVYDCDYCDEYDCGEGCPGFGVDKPPGDGFADTIDALRRL